MSHRSTETIEFLAPSTFCRGTGFDTWMVTMNAEHVVIPPPEVEAYYLQLSEFSLPTSVLQIPTNNIKDQPEFLSSLKEWAAFHPASLCDDDEFRMCELWPLLCFAYSRIKQSAKINANEATQRRGVGDLIDLAFCFRKEGQCIVRTEEAFRLGAIPAGATPPATLPNPTPIADILVTSLPSQPLSKGKGSVSTYWQQFWGEKNMFSLILFAGEFKQDLSDRNKNQLVMSLITAQHQRRALGMEDGIILGATYVMGGFVTYSSKWLENGTLTFYEHPEQRLSDPVAFLQCYSFLCRLHDHVKTFGDKLMVLDISHRQQSLINRTWRTPDKPRLLEGSKGGSLGASKKPGRDTNQEFAEPLDLKMQEEAGWKASRDEWQKQSNEDSKRTSSMGTFNMLTAESLEHLDSQGLNYKIKKWSRSLDGGVDPDAAS